MEFQRDDTAAGSTSSESPTGPPSKRQRKRPSFVCTNCKRRKIRCDRQTPCSNCIRSKHQDSCRYEAPNLKQLLSSDRSNKPIDGTSSFSVNERIDEAPPLLVATAQDQRQSNELQDEMSRLKTQISNLETLLIQSSKSNQIQPPHKCPSLMDLKLSSFKHYYLVAKSSRISVRGPLSLSVPRLNPSLALVLRKFIDTERDAWKLIHGSVAPLSRLLTCNPVSEDIISKIENSVVPNYQAIRERLAYFKDNLNDLLYNGFVDMAYVFDCINIFFKKVESNKCKFVKPLNDYHYSKLSLILALVESACLFSDQDPDNTFRFQLDKSALETIIELSKTTLVLSNYQRKQNYAALISLIVLKDNFYTYSISGSDSMDETKSGYINTLALVYSFQVGLHRDPSSLTEVSMNRKITDQVYHLPEPSHKTLWCHLKMLDADYSVSAGTPLLINETFSDTSAPANIGSDMLVMFTNLQRETSLLVNSVNPFSLNDIIKIYEKHINFNISIGTFQDLLSPDHAERSNTYLDLIAQKISIKLKSVRVIGMLMGFIRTLLLNNSFYPTDQINFKNLTMLKEQASFYEREYSKFVMLTGALVTALSNGENTVFGTRLKKYLVYFKTDLLRLLYPGFLLYAVTLICSYLTSANPKAGDFEINSSKLPLLNIDTSNIQDFDLSTFADINYRDVELSLLGRYDPDRPTEALDRNIKTVLSRPKQIVKYFLELHASLSSSPIFSQNYGYFTFMKTVSVFACFADSLIKISESHSPNSSGLSTNYPENGMDGIWEQTKKKILNTMKVGYVDMGFSLEENKDSLEQWLNSFFDLGNVPLYDAVVPGKDVIGAELASSGWNSFTTGSVPSPSPSASFPFARTLHSVQEPSSLASPSTTSRSMPLGLFSNMMPMDNIISDSLVKQQNQQNQQNQPSNDNTAPSREDNLLPSLRYLQNNSASVQTEDLINGYENSLTNVVDDTEEDTSNSRKSPVGGSYQMFF